MDNKPLTKKEFRNLLLQRIEEEAKRTGRPEREIMKEVIERMRKKMQQGPANPASGQS